MTLAWIAQRPQMGTKTTSHAFALLEHQKEIARHEVVNTKNPFLAAICRITVAQIFNLPYRGFAIRKLG